MSTMVSVKHTDGLLRLAAELVMVVGLSVVGGLATAVVGLFSGVWTVVCRLLVGAAVVGTAVVGCRLLVGLAAGVWGVWF